MRFFLSCVVGGCGGLTYYGDPSGGGPADQVDSVDSGTEIGTPDPDGAIALAVDAVVPTFGSDAGGTEVVVTGSFDDQAVLGFGGVQATILSRTATEIVAVAPASASTGWVDVTVASGARSAVLPDGFEYWADGSGLAGTAGYVERYHFVGGYWLDAEDYASASFGFVEPLDWEPYREYALALDTCSAVDPYTDDLVWLVSGATAWAFDANGPSFEIPEDAVTPGWFASDAVDAPLALTDVVPGASYDLHAQPANMSWPVNHLVAGVSVPAAFTVSQPNLAATDAPLQKKGQFTISWSGSGGDYVLIFLMRRDGAETEIVTCAATDDGSFTVPGTAWSTWPLGLFMDVIVGRVIVDRTTLPMNNSENRLAGAYWVWGGVLTD